MIQYRRKIREFFVKYGRYQIIYMCSVFLFNKIFHVLFHTWSDFLTHSTTNTYMYIDTEYWPQF